MPEYYYLKDVAKMVGVSQRTIHRWIKEGKIPDSDRDRNNWRIYDEKTVDEIKDYANKVTPAPHKLQATLFSPEQVG